MEAILPNPAMADVRFRSGGSYTLTELAELARRGLEEKGLTQQQAAEWLNENVESKRGKIRQPHISAALNDPENNPGFVLMLVKAFSNYDVNETPRYQIERKG